MNQITKEGKDIFDTDNEDILIVNANSDDDIVVAKILAAQIEHDDPRIGDFELRDHVGGWRFVSAYKRGKDTVELCLTPLFKEEGVANSYEDGDDQTFTVRINPDAWYALDDILEVAHKDLDNRYYEELKEYNEMLAEEKSYRHMVEIESRYW